MGYCGVLNGSTAGQISIGEDNSRAMTRHLIRYWEMERIRCSDCRMLAAYVRMSPAVAELRLVVSGVGFMGFVFGCLG